jgi:hypothetical protein
MKIKALQTRVAKLERCSPQRVPGIHRYSDDELSGLIAILRQAETGEALDPIREEWAAALLKREGLLS